MQVQEHWIQLVAGTDLYFSEALRRNLDAMRNELAGPRGTPLERLLIDRILAVYVQTLYLEAQEAQTRESGNVRLARFEMERQNQAHRQLLASIKMLATVCQLTARTNTIQVQLLNPPMSQPTQSPIAPAVNSARSEMCNGPKSRFNAHATTLASGINRLNSSRAVGALDPITAAEG